MKTIRVLAMTLIVSACADESWVDGGDGSARAPPAAKTIELIGVSGRRLADGDDYRVPLDYASAITWPNTTRREAFVIRNLSLETVTLLALAVTSGDGLAGEWAVLAPVRASERPLDASGIRLPPGTRLDFDVQFRPREEGERDAELTLLIAFSDHTEVRAVTLRARCARDPPRP